MSPGTATRRRLFRFALVGVAGFLVDGGLLHWLVASELCGPIAARAISFPAAVLATWFLHRRITFADPGPVLRSLLRYLLVSSAGTALNFVVYSALVVSVGWMAAQPLVPFAIASGIAMAFNYVGARHFAFSDVPPD